MKLCLKHTAKKAVALLLAGIMVASDVPSISSYASEITESTSEVASESADSTSEASAEITADDNSGITTEITVDDNGEVTVNDTSETSESLETDTSSTEISTNMEENTEDSTGTEENTEDVTEDITEYTTGYATIEVSGNDVDLSSLVYHVYSDKDLTDKVGSFVMSYDGKSYLLSNEDVVYSDFEALTKDSGYAEINYLELDTDTTYYVQMDKTLYKSTDKVDSKNIVYNDAVTSFTVNSDNITKADAYVIKVKVETSAKGENSSSEDEESSDDDSDPDPDSEEASEETATESTEEIVYVEAASETENAVSSEGIVLASGTFGTLSSSSGTVEDNEISDDVEESATPSDAKDTEEDTETESDSASEEEESTDDTETEDVATDTDATGEDTVVSISAISSTTSLLSTATLFASSISFTNENTTNYFGTYTYGSTFHVTYNGSTSYYAFCGDHDSDAPGSQSSISASSWSGDTVRRFLYYVYKYEASGNTYSGMTNAERFKVSIGLNYILNQENKNNIANYVNNALKKVTSAPPTSSQTDFSVSSSSLTTGQNNTIYVENVKSSSTNKYNWLRKTQSITLTRSSANAITVTLPKYLYMEYNDTWYGSSSESISVSIPSGTSSVSLTFALPTTYEGSSLTAKFTGKEGFDAYYWRLGSSYQRIFWGIITSADTASVTVSNEYGYLRLRKTSNEASTTKSDGCYNSVFTVYDSMGGTIATAKVSNYYSKEDSSIWYILPWESSWSITEYGANRGASTYKNTSYTTYKVNSDEETTSNEVLLKLPAGTYKITETTVPDGYTTSTMTYITGTSSDRTTETESGSSISVTITSDHTYSRTGSATVTATNTKGYGYLQVLKTSDTCTRTNSSGCAGAVFTVYDGTSTSSSKAIATATIGSCYVTSDGTVYYGVGAKSTAYQGGWEVTSYGSSTVGATVVISEKRMYVSNSSTEYYQRFLKLPAGTYTIVETTYADGATPVTEKNEITITSDGNSSITTANTYPYKAINTSASGYLQVLKRSDTSSATDPSGCEGAEFTIYRGSSADDDFAVATATIGHFEQTVASSGNSYYGVGNSSSQGQWTILDYGTELGAEAVSSSISAVDTKTMTSCYGTSDSVSQYFLNLPTGTYTIVETTYVDGYAPTKKTDTFTIEEDENNSFVYQYKAINKQAEDYGYLRVLKRSSYSSASSSDGCKNAVFTVYDSTGTTKIATATISDYYKQFSSGTYYYCVTEDGWNIESSATDVTKYESETTLKNSSGNTTSEYYLKLPLGTYIVYETTVPSSYKATVTSSSYEVTITNDTTEIKEVNITTEGSLNLIKKYNNTTIGNLSNYSLAGATYKVYKTTGKDVANTSSDDYICTFVTNDSGIGQVTDYASGYTVSANDDGVANAVITGKGLAIGDYIYVIETDSSDGCFASDGVTYEINDETNITTISDTEDTMKDPLNIQLQKIDADTGELIDSAFDLSGTQFTIKYYDVDPDTYTTVSSLSSLTPTRKWIYETDETGYIDFANVSYFYGGDELYYNADNKIIIPLGVITIEETLAPEGFLLCDAFISSKDGSTLSDDGILLISVTEEAMNSSEGLGFYVAGNYLESIELKAEEQVIRGGFSIYKYDEETETNVALGGANLEATFDLINKNEYSVAVDTNGNGTFDEDEIYEPDDVILTFYTDAETGEYTSPSDFLPYGTYEVVETYPPEGYLLYSEINPTLTMTFKIRVDKEIVTSGTYVNGDGETVESDLCTFNTVARGDIYFVKKNEDGEAMPYIPFLITSYDRNGNAIESHIVYTDANGVYSSATAYVLHTYNTNYGDNAELDSETGYYVSDCKGAVGTWFGKGKEISDDLRRTAKSCLHSH